MATIQNEDRVKQANPSSINSKSEKDIGTMYLNT
jgi:hypothetical protein